MNNLHFKIEALRSDIEALFLEYPELRDDEQFRADVFEGQTSIEAVLVSLVDNSRDAATMSQAISLRMKELGERKSLFDRREEAARKLILSLMEKANLPKIQLTEATLSTRQIAPSPFVTDATLLPDDCVRIERKPDMAAIKAALEGNRDIPGVAMSNGKTSLTIRIK